VSASKTPYQVTQAIDEIVKANGPVTVHVVGGPLSVPDARLNDIKRAVGASNVVVDRLVSRGDRFDVAAEIADRVAAEWESAFGAGAKPDAALIANGADPAKFFDAMALSAISAADGFPILLVSQDAVPAATAAALQDVAPDRVVIGGGPATVGTGVKSRIGQLAGTTPEQWYGHDRYRTAAVIAGKGCQEGWLWEYTVGVAAKLPDALTGGSASVRSGAPLLMTDGGELSFATGDWLMMHAGMIGQCYVYGGPVSVDEFVVMEIEWLIGCGMYGGAGLSSEEISQFAGRVRER
jgi:hypothetical protein